MWDDGQRWSLRVRDDATVAQGWLLFDDRIQLDRLSFWAVQTELPPPVLVLQLATGAGVQVWEVRYDASRGGFVEGPKVAAIGNVIHRTPAKLE